MSRLARPRLVRLRLAAALLVVTALGACGLFDNGLGIDFLTPKQDLRVDVSQLLPGSGQLPDLPCDQCTALCSQSPECNAVCAAGGCQCSSGHCRAEITLPAVATTVRPSDSPDFKKIQGQPIGTVTVKTLYYLVPENTLNFDTPVTQVYIGPAGAAQPTDSGVVAFATLPAIPAQRTYTSAQSVAITAAGQSALAQYLKTPNASFVLIAVPRVAVQGGQAWPAGAIRLQVWAQASIGL